MKSFGNASRNCTANFTYRAAYCSADPAINFTLGGHVIQASCNCGGKTVMVVQGGGLIDLSSNRDAQLECVSKFVDWYSEVPLMKLAFACQHITLIDM